MKSNLIKIVFLVLVVVPFLISCSQEDDGIYFEDITELSLRPGPVTYTNMELEILQLVNEHRKKLNLSKLIPLDIISKVAKTHTDYMIEVGQVSHENFSERSQTLINNVAAKSVAENVAFGFSSAQGVFNGWLNSSGHKRIIETVEYTHFGIKTKTDSNGRNYFTHLFIKI